MESSKNKEQTGVSKLLNDRVWYTQGSQNVAKLRSDTSEAQNVWRWNTTRSVTSGSLRNDVMLCMWMKSYGKGVFTLLRSHEWESPWVWQVQNINRWVLQKYSLRNLSPSISSLHQSLLFIHSTPLACMQPHTHNGILPPSLNGIGLSTPFSVFVDLCFCVMQVHKVHWRKGKDKNLMPQRIPATGQSDLLHRFVVQVHAWTQVWGSAWCIVNFVFYTGHNCIRMASSYFF